ncbi:hypothetical protein LWI28_003319 [Acer negundo]|uniref:Uncharacterized protein n=1 Tax=Acer negundo TaxID=4023 RepID=A0AAD5NZ87_ACENE|nr:hypothetical protein LWI28_003319 [Acer negundo]
MRRPRGPKRAQIKDEVSKSDAEGLGPEVGHDEGAGEDVNVRMLTQILKVLKATRSEQVDASAARSEEIRKAKEDILREIVALKGRTRAIIIKVEDRLMEDFAKLRTELKIVIGDDSGFWSMMVLGFDSIEDSIRFDGGFGVKVLEFLGLEFVGGV